MMENIVNINGNELNIKMWNGQRVITFVDIDKVHERPEGTAHRNFKKNKKHLIENEDYFVLKPSDVLKDEFRPLGFETEKPANRGTTYLTESGYLLLVKSFTDDLAWNVQRQLVKSYFKLQELVDNFNENYPINVVGLNDFMIDLKNNLPCVYAQINNMEEMIGEQNSMLERVIDNMTLSTKQQQEMYKAAKDRINHLLNGAHSIEYKKKSKSYFVNLWNNMKSKYNCGSSYKDLNPMYFDEAMEYIKHWEYKEQ